MQARCKGYAARRKQAKKRILLLKIMQKSFIINNLEFAQNQLKLTDIFDVDLLTRLSETLSSQDKTAVYFELTGTGKQFRQPVNKKQCLRLYQHKICKKWWHTRSFKNNCGSQRKQYPMHDGWHA